MLSDSIFQRNRRFGKSLQALMCVGFDGIEHAKAVRRWMKRTDNLLVFYFLIFSQTAHRNLNSQDRG